MLLANFIHQKDNNLFTYIDTFYWLFYQNPPLGQSEALIYKRSVLLNMCKTYNCQNLSQPAALIDMKISVVLDFNNDSVCLPPLRCI